MEKVGAVLVVGGGIGGIQASMDLADSGYKVYLVESSMSIGGVMAQLDKTFPTNDCSICILAPKLVAAGRHENIDIIIGTIIEKVEGEAGNFFVDIKQKSLYLDQNKCTGCGLCSQVCPVEAIDVFNEGLSTRSAISVKFPQAVPLVYSIDKDMCIGCGICEGRCEANAIDYTLEHRNIRINVGAIILAIGFDEFDPTPLKIYGYGKYLNVVTSTQFERTLSASGPFSGTILRTSDGLIPKKIAFLQCIGSRDKNIGIEYCSSVCCMYTAKEAVIAKEHMDIVEPTIFSMDIRACGKDFDKYITRAQEEYGVRYIRRRISYIREVPDTKDLKVYYETESGKIVEEIFNLIVLAVGAQPPHKAKELAEKLNIELNEYGFCKTKPFSPAKTSREGIFVCGMFSEPKDIPETVVEASAAAGAVNVFLSDVRDTLIAEKEYPEELDISGDPPRIGVFVCHCGINIGGVVNVPEVVEYAKTLPNIIYVERNLYTCSADTQTNIKKKIKEHNLNRVIVASCTPRTHEPLFQETIREAGLNKYLFDLANIRDQCSWVHMHEPEEATEKAKDLVRMSVSKARNLVPLQEQEININHKGLIIGGGIAGMNASLNLADQGYEVFLVEKNEYLGGIARNIYETLENNDVQKFLQELIEKVSNHKFINVFLEAEINSVSGYIGNFTTDITFSKEKKKKNVTHGIIIVATGAKEYEPQVSDFLFGQDDRIMTQSSFEKILFTNEEKIKKLKSLVMIQCVGSRNDEHPYCSRICCSEAVKNALKAKKINPRLNISILYRDIRTYGFKEKYYNLAREKGILFIRFDNEKPPQIKIKDGKVVIQLHKIDIGEINIYADLTVLSTGIIAPEDNFNLAQMLKVPLNEDSFFLEAHVKLKPSDFATNGIFLCGTARGAANIRESISQANSAASRAVTILSKDVLKTEGITSQINENKCIGCGRCIEICPYNAIELIETTKQMGLYTSNNNKARVIKAICKGCGTCMAECPASAITMSHFGNTQIEPMIKEAVKSFDKNGKPRIVAFLCNWCSYAGADLAGVSRYQYPPNIRVIRVMCSGGMSKSFILQAFLEGADGVFIAGCHLGDCHYISGNENAYLRMDHLKNLLKKIGIEEERMMIHAISASEGKQFSELITEFTMRLKKLGEFQAPIMLEKIKIESN
ncbi:MAG: hydrogenase iron-sulfur subunit [Candidatus Lokiarchaeota archaeon]|nr:hydrogenase iron-sulfur subunit [Candidatus Lokiarchaeota archaeon]